MMIISLFRTFTFLIVLLMMATGCGTTAKYPHELVKEKQKLGVFGYIDDQLLENNQFSTPLTLASRNYATDIQKRLALLPTDKMVLKYFLQSFPARTTAQVLPILDSQLIKKDHSAKVDNSEKVIDVLATGKSLSLDYVISLKVSRGLKSTGYLYQEKWRPRLALTIDMIRITDGKILLHDLAIAEGNAFDKYLDTRALNKTLALSLSSSASRVVNELSEKIGPPIRNIPENEKLAQQKIYDYGHIRSMAKENNCVISGDLKVSKTRSHVTYQVPCRDITLTYACDNDSDASHCWLQ